VIDGRAVHDRVAARGVVADHAADRGPVGGRRVGPEQQAERRGGAVEVVLHHARPDAGHPRASVDLDDRVHVARHIEDERAGADRLAGQAGAAAARDDRDVETAAATSPAPRGNATASGSRAYMLASDAYRRRVYASSRTSASSRRSAAASAVTTAEAGSSRPR
jgi:hypothetical protein